MAQLSGLNGEVSGPVVPPLGALAVAAPAAAVVTPGYIFTATGEKIQAAGFNAGLQFGEDVAMDAAGNATVVWTDGFFGQPGLDGSEQGIYARRFDATGKPLGVQFRVNNLTEGAQDHPALGLDGQGRAVIAYVNDTFWPSVRVQRMNLDGTRAAELIVQQSDGANSYLWPKILVAADGSFTVAFTDNDMRSGEFRVWLQRYDAANKLISSQSMAVGLALAAGEQEGFAELYSHLRLGADGSVYIADARLVKTVSDVGWQFQGRVEVSRLALDGSITRHRVYQSAWEAADDMGRPTGEAATIIVNSPDVFPVADGGYLWAVNKRDAANSNSGGVAVEKRSVTGAVVTPLTKVTDSAKFSGLNAFAQLADGNVLITTSVYTPFEGATTSGRLLGPNGQPVGDAFSMLDNGYGDALRIAVAPGGGTLAVTWQDEHPGRGEETNGVPLVFFDKVLPNKAPTAVQLANTTTTLPENTSTANLVKVADIVITDDTQGTNTISLSGADAASFEVNGTSLFLTAGVDLNFEAKKSYAVTVSVQDETVAGSAAVTAAFVLAVTNVDEVAPTITSAAVATTVNENIGVNQIVYTATATDSADISGGVSFSLGGADNAAFSIDAATGVVRLLANPDFETKPTYSFAVLATDKARNSSSLPVTLKINNVNEAPTIRSSATVSVFENRTSVMGVFGVDPEAAKVSYRIVGGADAAKFTINAVTGALAFKAAPNFEAPTDAGADNIYQVAVEVSDGSLTSPVQTIAVGVLNVNEPPVGIAKTITVARKASYTFTAGDFGFRDLGDKTPNALKAVRIASLPTRGSLKKDGVAVKAGDLITAADIAAGKLRFTPVANTSGVPYASFKFRVQDDGGALNGGVDIDPVAKVMTIRVR